MVLKFHPLYQLAYTYCSNEEKLTLAGQERVLFNLAKSLLKMFLSKFFFLLCL